MIKDAARPAEAVSGRLTPIISSLDPRRSWAKVRPLACRRHRLSFPQHPPEGAREHPSQSCPPQPTTQKGSHVLGRKAQVLDQPRSPRSCTTYPTPLCLPLLPPIPALTPLQPHVPPLCSSISPGAVLPQGLCTAMPPQRVSSLPSSLSSNVTSLQSQLLSPSFPLTSYFLVLPAPRLLIFLYSLYFSVV